MPGQQALIVLTRCFVQSAKRAALPKIGLDRLFERQGRRRFGRRGSCTTIHALPSPLKSTTFTPICDLHREGMVR